MSDERIQGGARELRLAWQLLKEISDLSDSSIFLTQEGFLYEVPAYLGRMYGQEEQSGVLLSKDRIVLVKHLGVPDLAICVSVDKQSIQLANYNQSLTNPQYGYEEINLPLPKAKGCLFVIPEKINERITRQKNLAVWQHYEELVKASGSNFENEILAKMEDKLFKEFANSQESWVAELQANPWTARSAWIAYGSVPRVRNN
jgi:hypothetical protein